jgi:hypothetical protein
MTREREKQSVLRARRLRRVRKGRCFRSLFCIDSFPTVSCTGGRCRRWTPALSVSYRVMPQGSSKARSLKNSVWRCQLNELALKKFPLTCRLSAFRGLFLLLWARNPLVRALSFPLCRKSCALSVIS